MKRLNSLKCGLRSILNRTISSSPENCQQCGAPTTTSAVASTSGIEAGTSGQPSKIFQDVSGSQARQHGPSGRSYKVQVSLLAGGFAAGALGILTYPRIQQLSAPSVWSKDALPSYLPSLPSIPSWSAFGQALQPDVQHPQRYPIGPNFLADAAAKAAPAVVNININAPPSAMGILERSCGSGFITDAEGIIMTNAHVVAAALEKQRASGRNREGAAPLTIALQDGRVFEGRVLSLDRVSDLALVKIDAEEPLPTVQMGSSAGMRVGEWVLALGSPLTLQNSVTAGIVSCVDRKGAELGLGSASDFIQTDAAINTGNSGGPLINLAGEVVGISCMKALHCNGVSFAIPIDAAREVSLQLREQGRVVRPYIGIQMLQLNAHNAAQMRKRDANFPDVTQGILVPSVAPGSPAEKAGLRAGDIIKAVGEAKEDMTTAALIKALGQHVGKPLKLRVLRAKQKELTLNITASEATYS